MISQQDIAKPNFSCSSEGANAVSLPVITSLPADQFRICDNLIYHSSPGHGVISVIEHIETGEKICRAEDIFDVLLDSYSGCSSLVEAKCPFVLVDPIYEDDTTPACYLTAKDAADLAFRSGDECLPHFLREQLGDFPILYQDFLPGDFEF